MSIGYERNIKTSLKVTLRQNPRWLINLTEYVLKRFLTKSRAPIQSIIFCSQLPIRVKRGKEKRIQTDKGTKIHCK